MLKGIIYMEKKNIKIFLICGKARHGKDTVAKIIKEKYEMDNLKSITLSYAYYNILLLF